MPSIRPGRGSAPLLLELDLTEPLLEDVPPDPLSQLQARRRTRLDAVLTGLRDAADDPRVRGLVARAGGRRLPLGRAQELRDAVGQFRRSGKPTVAWAQTFGEFQPATVPYYLASAFGEIWLQPSGDVGLTGVAIGTPFLAETLQRVGVQVQAGRRYEYKNAPNVFTERGFTPAHREATGRVAESAFQQVLSTVAEERGLAVDRLRLLVDRAPLSAAEALAAGLVDRVGYRDEVYAELRRRTGADARLLYLGRYRRHRGVAQLPRRLRAARQAGVAVIHGTGTIRLGRTGRGPLTGRSMGADTVAAALRSAGREPRVHAVVFRVNSPGGSYVASDVIWREVHRLRQAGKPVVVSMGDVAASGGYFVAAPADLIVAQPGTLTGSIGVFGGKAVLGDLLARFGVRFEAVELGAHARMNTPTRPFTEDEWQRMQEWLDRVYDDFVDRVAAGRRMDRQVVAGLARGRVWTGADAAERGLVDELGGLSRALTLARQRAQLPADAPVRRFPAVSPLARLRGPRSSEDAAAAAAVAGPQLADWAAECWGPVGGLAGAFGLPAGGPLLLPGLRLT